MFSSENTFLFLISNFSGPPFYKNSQIRRTKIFLVHFVTQNAFTRHTRSFRIYAINVFLYFLLIVKLDAGMYAVPLDAYEYIGSHIILYTNIN